MVFVILFKPMQKDPGSFRAAGEVSRGLGPPQNNQASKFPDQCLPLFPIEMVVFIVENS
jgi:hypothetical protein